MKNIIILLTIVFGLLADDYTLSTSKPKHGKIEVDKHSLTYTHTDSLYDDVTVGLDSIMITAVDDAGNTDSSKSYILIIPKQENPSDLELYTLNNPLDIIGTNVKQITNLPPQLDLVRVFHNDRGIVFIIGSKQKLDFSELNGRLVIFDVVGNMINNQTLFNSITYDNGEYYYTAVAIWDGRNNNGRLVGAESFIAYIEITVKGVTSKDLIFPKGFENYSDSISYKDINEQTYTFNKVVGVRKHQ